VILRILLNNKEFQYALSGQWARYSPAPEVGNRQKTLLTRNTDFELSSDRAVRLIGVLQWNLQPQGHQCQECASQDPLVFCVYEPIWRSNSAHLGPCIMACGRHSSGWQANVTLIEWLLKLVKKHEGVEEQERYFSARHSLDWVFESGTCARCGIRTST